MAQSLNECLEEINGLLSALPYAGNTTFYKLAYLQTKNDRDGNERLFPIVRRGQSEAYQISPQDVKSMVFYHRIIDQTDEPTDQGKGTAIVMYTTYTMRLVAIGHRRKLSSLNDEDNADLATAVKLLINGKTLTDRSKVWPVSANSNKLDVLNEEFDGYDFNNESLEITAFAIDYSLKQRQVCIGSPPSIITLLTLAYSNNGQTIQSQDFVTMSPTITPSGATVRYYVDANDTLPTGLSLSEDTGIITRTGTIPNDTYSFDIIAAGYGNTTGVASVRVTLTVATVSPTLSNPVDASSGETTGTGSIDTDSGEGTLYWVLTTSATQPTAVQIKAGQDHTGSAATDSGSQAVNATGTQTISGGFTGLTASTTYYAHYYQEDNDLDGSNISSGDGFTTDGVYNAYTQAVLDRNTALGYTAPSGAYLDAINDLVEYWDTEGVLALLDRLFIWGGNGDANSKTLDWIDPTRAGSNVNSPIYDNFGIKGDGVAAYFDSGFSSFDDGVQYTLNAASIIIYRLIDVVSGSNIASVGLTEAGFPPQFRSQNSTFHKINSAGNLNASIDLSGTGLKVLNRSSSTNVQGYSDSTTAQNATSTADDFGGTGETIDFFVQLTNRSDEKLMVGAFGGDITSKIAQIKTGLDNLKTALEAI